GSTQFFQCGGHGILATIVNDDSGPRLGQLASGGQADAGGGAGAQSDTVGKIDLHGRLRESMKACWPPGSLSVCCQLTTPESAPLRSESPASLHQGRPFSGPSRHPIGCAGG